MLNKKLVLGSLAGATLLIGAAVMLPTVAEAAVGGACANCHTMHASVEGSTSTPNAYLLTGGCWSCHSGATNDASGLDPVTPFAPQVDNTGATMLAGGYFGTTTTMQHGVVDNALEVAASNLLIAPGSGGTFTFVQDGTTGDFNCTDCHGEAGHHAAAGSYRMLNADADNSGTADGAVVTAGSSPLANFGVAAEYNANNYDGGDTLNLFCAECHPNFHNTTNTGSASAFTRHPTNMDVITSYAGATFDAVVPVGAAGTADNLLCISCHRPHGSGVTDLLRFAYDTANNVAGDGPADAGCEQCHGAK